MPPLLANGPNCGLILVASEDPPTRLPFISGVIAVVGVVQLIQGQIIFGIVLLIAACLVGPGGYSIFRARH